MCRMHKVALEGTSAGGTSKIAKLANLRKLALKCIDEFVMSFSNPQAFAAAAASSAPTALLQVMEAVSIEEAGQLRCRFSLSVSLCVTYPVGILVVLQTLYTAFLIELVSYFDSVELRSEGLFLC